MKTQIIQLEAHDDTISVRDKMDWSQTPRILLVWPERGKIFRKRLDLVLLERYCSSHGSQLALLTTDPEVQFQAQEAGIPVFQSRKSAQLQPWRKSFREFQRTELQQSANQPRDRDLYEKPETPRSAKLPPWGRIILFTTGVLSVLTIAALLLPSAEISIQEVVFTRELTIPVQVVPEANKVNIAGIIPAREIVTRVEGERSRTATGSLAVPDQHAEGEVVFTNLTETAIEIPKNSILSTSGEDPVLFFTLESGSTPPGIGEQIAIKIKALAGGPQGNVPANQINRINQEFGADLTVINPESTFGGSNLLVPAPSQSDRTMLSSILAAELEKKALEQIQESLQKDAVLFESTLYLVEIEEEKSVPAPGIPGDRLTLSRIVHYGITYGAGEDIQQLAQETINARLHGSNFRFIPNSLVVEHRNLSDQLVKWNLHLEWEEVLRVSEQDIIQLALGKTPTEAISSIQGSNQLLNPPEITLNPKWWIRLPVLPFRIKLYRSEG